MGRLTGDSYERGELGQKGRIKEQEISSGKLVSQRAPAVLAGLVAKAVLDRKGHSTMR
jgi:hypothetical protein